MLLYRATEADAQGIDEPAITTAPEPSSVAARSSVNPGSTKPPTGAECDTPVATFPDRLPSTCRCRQTGCRGSCTSGWTAATRRGGGSVCAVGTLGHGKVHAGAQVRCGTGRARRRVAAAGVHAIGLDLQRSRMRGCSTSCWAKAPGGRRRTPLKRCVGGFTSSAVSGVEQGMAGGPRRPARAGRRRAGEGSGG
jgi:hypothetical protein